MRASTYGVLSLALLLLAPRLVHAEIYDDGGQHVLDHATTEMVEVDNATELELVAGARIEPSSDTNGLQAVGGSTVVLRAGEIVGGTGPMQRIALASWNCDVEIHDGVTLLGGVSTGSTGGKGAHVDAPTPYSCRIAGGQLLGRDNSSHGGPGATLRGNLQILGGLFRGGNGSWGSGGMGLWILGGSGVIQTAEVRGGTGFVNGGPALVVNDADLTIEHGYFVGGDGQQSGGTALKTSGVSHVIVRGGGFHPGTGTPPNSWALAVTDQSVMELRGGTVEARVLVTDDAELIVYGSGLTGAGSGYVDGVLADGKPISVSVATFDNGRVTLVETVTTESSTFGGLKARY